jgi:phage host-nuclease inhibitor protein Gam
MTDPPQAQPDNPNARLIAARKELGDAEREVTLAGREGRDPTAASERRQAAWETVERLQRELTATHKAVQQVDPRTVGRDD